MIRIDEVAKKLENVLNGTDPEVVTLIGEGKVQEPPTGFYFRVATEGFHIDKIYDEAEGRNFIPVFISSMGGQFNPVPELLQANFVLPVAIYFPVRFKDDLFKLNEYLAQVFVGRQLDYGENSGSALSNISVAQFGEIVEYDLLEQYKTWEETTYKKPIEVMEPLLQMQFQLYLSTAASEFVYGNDGVASLTIEGIELTDPDLPDDWTDGDNSDNLSFVQESIQSNSEPAVQQIMGTNEVEGLPTGTSYGSSFSVYIKNSNFYKYLLKKWFDGNSQELTLTLSFSIMGLTFTRTCFVQSVNLIVQKGELVTITFSFIKKASVVIDG